MGNRVHVVKKQREYGSTDAFNWAFEEFKYLLTSLGCNVCEQDDYSSDFEMTCDEYERAMTILTRIVEAKKKDKNISMILTSLILLHQMIHQIGTILIQMIMTSIM